MFSYKGFVHRWLATVVQLAPFTKERIMNVMKTSATAAVKQCSGSGPPGYGRTCGFRWDQEYDGTNGAGQEMNVLGALTAMLYTQVDGPLTNLTGGTSEGDYTAGDDANIGMLRRITPGDTAGASILTALVLALTTATFVWMSTEYYEGAFD
jgi:mannan endo-1,6-alpha-mannosidase